MMKMAFDQFLKTIFMVCFGFSVVLEPCSASTFTGAFGGQGEGCWGNLYIRTRTIEWNTPYSLCESTKYTIIKQTFTKMPTQNGDQIIYKLDHQNSKCSFQYIGLYYDHYSDQDKWAVAGFPRYKDYQNFDYKAVIVGFSPVPLPILVCELPEYEKP